MPTWYVLIFLEIILPFLSIISLRNKNKLSTIAFQNKNYFAYIRNMCNFD